MNQRPTNNELPTPPNFPITTNNTSIPNFNLNNNNNEPMNTSHNNIITNDNTEFRYQSFNNNYNNNNYNTQTESASFNNPSNNNNGHNNNNNNNNNSNTQLPLPLPLLPLSAFSSSTRAPCPFTKWKPTTNPLKLPTNSVKLEFSFQSTVSSSSASHSATVSTGLTRLYPSSVSKVSNASYSSQILNALHSSIASNGAIPPFRSAAPKTFCPVQKTILSITSIKKEQEELVAIVQIVDELKPEKAKKYPKNFYEELKQYDKVIQFIPYKNIDGIQIYELMFWLDDRKPFQALEAVGQEEYYILIKWRDFNLNYDKYQSLKRNLIYKEQIEIYMENEWKYDGKKRKYISQWQPKYCWINFYYAQSAFTFGTYQRLLKWLKKNYNLQEGTSNENTNNMSEDEIEEENDNLNDNEKDPDYIPPKSFFTNN
eukprot:55179_1